MRVVLDTNVLLSALLSPHGWPDTLYRAWQKDRFDLVTSIAQVDELRRASRYAKFKDVLQPHRVGTMVNNMRLSIMLDALPPLPDGIEAKDPNDAFLLAMALTGDADYLVTGDHRAGLLQRGSMGRTRIVTPVAFCVQVQSYPTRYEPERGVVIPTRYEPEGGVWVDHFSNGDRHERLCSGHHRPTARLPRRHSGSFLCPLCR